MLISILLRAFAPFAAPVILLLAAVLLGRGRIGFLRKLPLWIFLVAIAVILLIWLLVAFLKWRAERKSAEAIEAGLELDKPPGPNVRPDKRPEFAEIQANMKEAIAVLKASPQGKKALYAIPWYVIIGPPATGKTTAILNSGLNFPSMTTAKRLRGQGGTRNCDWWLSTDAIILDTAGRYAQSTDRTETEPEWFAFLDLLKRNRKKNPLNGLILTYSMESLVGEDESTIIKDARELRQRLDEIMTKLGWSFPIYVLFTKTDLVSGFADFFSTLAPIDRLQVWGTTLQPQLPKGTSPADQFRSEYDILMQRLRDLRTQRIKATDREESWGRVFMFPEEMSSLRPKLHIFIETLFETNPFQHDQPLFRGAYFSSGRQMGRPLEIVVGRIQRILGASPAGFGVEEQEEKEDAYFVRDLFTKIFRLDQNLARSTGRAGQKMDRIKWIISGATAVVAILLSILVIGSYGSLQIRMNNTFKAARTVSQNAKSEASAEYLQLLSELREHVEASWTSPLFTASPVKAKATEIYRGAMRNRVLIPWEQEIYHVLCYPSDLEGLEVRQALRTELLFLDPGKAGDIGDAHEMAEGILRFGAPGYSDSGQVAKDVTLFCKDFLEAGIPLTDRDSRSEALRAGARRLRMTHEPAEYYARIVASASRVERDLTLEDLAGQQTILTSNRVIRAAYTKAGWSYVSGEINNVTESIEKDNRLIRLAGEEPGSHIPNEEDLLRRYIGHYPEEWSDFFGSVEMESYGGCADAKEDYSDLKSPKSPLLRLVQAAAEHSKFGSKAEAILGSNKLTEVEQAMSPIQRFVEPPEKEPLFSQEHYKERLGEISSLINKCSKGKLEEDPTELDEAAEEINDLADSYSGPTVADGLRALLLLPIKGAGEIIQTSVVEKEGEEIADIWSERAVAAYRNAIRGKYPFAGEEEAAAPSDVAEFFSSEGPLTRAKDALDEKSASPGPSTRAAYLKASRIRASLEADQGGLACSFRLRLSQPQSLGTPAGSENLQRINLVRLVINGHEKAVRGSVRWDQMKWTSDDPDPTSYLAVYEKQNQQVDMIDGGSSVWSWFKLVDQASEVEQMDDGWEITWEFAELGIAIVCEIKMTQGKDLPFHSRSDFRTFTLPGNYEN